MLIGVSYPLAEARAGCSRAALAIFITHIHCIIIGLEKTPTSAAAGWFQAIWRCRRVGRVNDCLIHSRKGLVFCSSNNLLASFELGIVGRIG